MSREYFRPVQVEQGLCIHCERCAMTCPNNAIIFKGYQRFIDYLKCKGCLSCVSVCPRNAISVTSTEENEVISVDVVFEKCNACGICEDVCSKNIWEQKEYEDKNGKIKTIFRVQPTEISGCIGCEICVNSCPEKIINIQKFSLKK
ncbi:MAG: 4Fe-4S dicluster domain-containing protein [archaeon]|nr:4Fe-4S dicluster domain-containing protein [archaeon]